jgi:hypothetical protein
MARVELSSLPDGVWNWLEQLFTLIVQHGQRSVVAEAQVTIDHVQQPP